MNKLVLSSILMALLMGFNTCRALAQPDTRAAHQREQQRITLNYRDINIRDAFSALAMEFKINIVLSNEVQGTITLHVFGLTLEEALSTIAAAGGYEYKTTGTIHRVYKATAAEKAEAAVPVRTEMKVFKASFVEIEKVKTTLDAVPGLNPIEVHEATKTIIVNDTPENIKKVEEIFSYLDAAPKQVLIEAEILKVTLDDSMVFGVDWKAILSDGIIQTKGLSSAILPGTAAGTDIITSGVTSPVPTDGNGVFANLIAGTGKKSQISLAIDALKTKTDVDTLSTPKVLAIHSKAAKVQVGGQQGYKVTTTNNGVSNETIQFIDTGTILEITPYIDAQNNVLLNVKPSINSATITAGIPVVTSTSVSTWLLAKDGETVFIAGLIETTDTKKKEGIPILGDIPVLGYLFGRTEDKKGKQELVVLITPKIIRNGSPAPPGY